MLLYNKLVVKLEQCSARINITDRNCTLMRFITDTGSDWCVIGTQNLRELGLSSSGLQTPTAEMCNTVTVTGEKMLSEGYNDVRFYYGCKQAESKLVVFKNIKTPLLSVEVLQKLNIVVIHSNESSVNQLDQANTSPTKIIRPD